MRQVNRNVINKPACLSVDLTNAIERVKTTGKIEQNIYSDPEVKDNLHIIYKSKCYICESIVSKDFYIEHYLPWSKDFPERAYDWFNLHLSCNKCNQKKRNEEFKKIDNTTGQKLIIDTLLIDPSNPPSGYTVEYLIGFDRHRKAYAKVTTEEKAVKTAKFLNFIELYQERNNRWDEVEDFLWLNIDLTLIWNKILAEDNLNVPLNEEYKKQYIKALERAYKFYQLFIDEKNPFSMCIQQVIFISKGYSKVDLEKLNNFYLLLKGITS